MRYTKEMQLKLDRIIGGGQTIGTNDDGKKILVWGGLPDETVEVTVTKKKSHYEEAIVEKVIKPSEERETPRDPDSYLSTSPWQIMNFAAEQHYKAALIEEAFELHDIVLPEPITVYSDDNQYEYRNKIEYSFWYDTETEKLSLAFFRRGSHGKVALEETSLAAPEITKLSKVILNILNDKKVGGRQLKTLLIRTDAKGNTAWQLYVKDEKFNAKKIIDAVHAQRETTCGEVIFSNPKSPASVITKRLACSSKDSLTDTILKVAFCYATESFFQINLPVYEHALGDMKKWVNSGPVVDLYSGVGTIGLTIGGNKVTLVESNESAVKEMRANISVLGRDETAWVVLAPSEKALEYIDGNSTIIVDPPRAGLHDAVIERLLETKPARIIYLSCNPVTQARDVAKLAETYGVRHHQGYNFFPRTPHIEHLIVLDVR